MLGEGFGWSLFVGLAILTIEFGIFAIGFACELSFWYWVGVSLRTLRQMILLTCGFELLATEG